MVMGAMHIHISILLFGLDEWFLDRNLLGHACMVNEIEIFFSYLFEFYFHSYEFFYSLVAFH